MSSVSSLKVGSSKKGGRTTTGRCGKGLSKKLIEVVVRTVGARVFAARVFAARVFAARVVAARVVAARVAAATPRVVAARLAGGRSLLLRDDLARELVRLRAGHDRRLGAHARVLLHGAYQRADVHHERSLRRLLLGPAVAHPAGGQLGVAEEEGHELVRPDIATQVSRKAHSAARLSTAHDGAKCTRAPKRAPQARAAYGSSARPEPAARGP
eukprot:scaffold76954_cov69-Phaeocystis_antarctica.AAC.1